MNVKRPDPVAALLKQRCRNRLVEKVEQPPFGEIHRCQQQIEVEVAPDHGGGAQSRTSVCAKTLHTPPDHLAHALGHAQIGEVSDEAPAPVLQLHDRPRLGEVAQHLTGEEWVARRLARYLRSEHTPVLVQLVPCRRLHQGHQVLGAQGR